MDNQTLGTKKEMEFVSMKEEETVNEDSLAATEINQDSNGSLETVQMNDYLKEQDFIAKNKKYHLDKTRNDLAKILILSLVLFIFAFGILHVVVEPKVVERLEDFSRYSIAVLSGLTGTTIGFFFRDLKDNR